MSSSPRPYVYTVRVGYADTDQMGFAHHSRYPVYLESARTELLRAMGSSYAGWERMGYLLPVTRLEVQFDGPAHYDDVLEVEVRLTRMTRLRLAFEYTIRREGEKQPLSICRTEHVFINRKGAPVRAPKELLNSLAAWSGGEGAL